VTARGQAESCSLRRGEGPNLFRPKARNEPRTSRADVGTISTRLYGEQIARFSRRNAEIP